MLKKILAGCVCLALGSAIAARAQDGEEIEWGKSGPYIGIGASYDIERLDDQFKVFTPGRQLHPTNSWGINSRLGYRIIPWVALEADFEWYQNFEFETAAGADLRRSDGWSLMGAIKGYPLTGRFQPYAIAGGGIIDIDSDNSFGSSFPGPQPPPRDPFNEETEPAIRGGLGFDVYPFRGPLRGVVLFGEGTYVYPFGDLEGFEFISVQFGLQYRFGIGKPAPAPPPPPPAPAEEEEEVEPVPPPRPSKAAPPPAVKKRIVLRGVNFDYNKSNIRADARPVLDEAIDTLRAQPGIRIVAEGHTDARGSDAYNQALSLRRAEAVREYLIKGGIAPSRIQVAGRGEAQPVASNESEDGRAQNRRVELRVVP